MEKSLKEEEEKKKTLEDCKIMKYVIAQMCVHRYMIIFDIIGTRRMFGNIFQSLSPHNFIFLLQFLDFTVLCSSYVSMCMCIILESCE